MNSLPNCKPTPISSTNRPSIASLPSVKAFLLLLFKGSKETQEPEESLGGALVSDAQKLKEEIIENLKNLEENEIQSAYDYADYMMHEDYEHKRLNIQNDRKSKF